MCGAGLCVGLCVVCRGDVCAFLLVLHRKRSRVYVQNVPVFTFKTHVTQRTRAFRTYTRERFERTHGSVSLFSSGVSLLSCLPLSSSRVSLFLSLLSQ